ncbi:hypothetical protein PENTCL1PPCAC_17895, partial [Pristionchus entomophagus]
QMEYSATGTITNVQTKFAYISSEKGSVFCPLAASVDSSEICSDMTEKYTIGDIVHFKAIKQSNKNGCDLRAVHMSISSKSSLYKGRESGDSARNDIIAEITLVQETLAYGKNEDIGGIFIPGAVFLDGNIKRLNECIKPGDLVNLSITRQAEKNGCRWRAVTAEMIALPEQSRGTGVITSLTDTVAIVQSHQYGIVRCGILAWEGGSSGSGESLKDVVTLWKPVVFEIMEPWNGIVASRWSLSSTGLIGDYLSPFPPHSSNVDTVEKREISTQTATHIERMVIKCIPNSIKQELYNRIPLIERLMDEVDLL